MVAQVALALAAAFALQIPAETPKSVDSKPAGATSGSTSAQPVQATALGLLRGIESNSSVIYDAAPVEVHRLRSAYAGQDRARWWLGKGEDSSLQRQMRLRSGADLFGFEAGSNKSLPFEGENRAQVLAQLELRRALLTWPAGLEWKGEGPERESSLGDLGRLRAHFADKATRPSELQFVVPGGANFDGYRAITWIDREGALRPSTCELWHGDKRVWKESIESVEAKSFSESYFIPADRRAGTAPPAARSVQQMSLQEYCGRRFEFAADASWTSAASELDHLRKEWGPKLRADGLELETKATVELTDDLRPRACTLRLTKIPSSIPPGFEHANVRTGVGLILDGMPALNLESLAALRTAVPKGMRPGTPYVRFELADPTIKQLVLVLPFSGS